MNKLITLTIISILFINFAQSQSNVLGQYLEFNGGDVTVDGQYVKIPDDASLDFDATQSFTIQFWVNPTNFSTTPGVLQGVVTKKTNTGLGYGVFWEATASGGRVRFLLNDGSVKSISSSNISNINSFDWVHVTAIMQRDANGTADSVFLYFDGQLEAKDETTTIDDVSNSNPLYLMRSASTGVISAGGSLDDVRIWQVALTEKQIHRLYSESIEEVAGLVHGKTSSKFTTLLWNKLVGYWDMSDSPTGFTIADQSLNTNNGIFYEAATACSVAPCGPKIIIPVSPISNPKPTYITAASGNWSAPGTWSGGNVPNSSNSIVFVNDGHILNLDGNFECQDFTLEVGATFISSSGVTLDVNQYFDIDGTFNNNFGTIRFVGVGDHKIYGESNIIEFFNFEMDQSNSQIQVHSPIVIYGILYPTNGSIRTEDNITLNGNTGNIGLPYAMIEPSNNPDVVGNIVIEKRLSNTNAGWRQMCMPLAGTVAGFSGLTLNTSTSANAADPNIYFWDNAQDGATPNNVGWKQASDLDNETKALTIYLDNPDYTFTQDFSFTGSYFSGDKDFVVTYFNDPGNPLSSGDVGYENGVGWNFIPNLYPSLLNKNSMIADNPLSYKSIHIWDAITQQYVAFTNVSSIIPYNNLGFPGAFSNFASIQPFQGFWVKTSSAAEDGTNFTLKDSWRTTVYAFTPHPSLKTINTAHIDVFASVDSTWDGIAIAFDDSYEFGFEADKDAYKIISNADVPSLYVEADKRFLQVSAVPNIEQSMPLHFTAAPKNSYGTYYIHLNDFELTPDWTVILEDKATNAKHDLSHSDYGFNASVYFNSDRFTLHFFKSNEASTVYSNEISAYFDNENIVVQNQSLIGLAMVELFDMSGKIYFKKSVQLSENFTIPVTRKSGILFLRVSHSSGVYTVKIPMVR